MDVSLCLTLPRENASVPLTRRMAVGCLNAVGVPGDEVDAIGLALTEACTNVLRHGHGGNDYDVAITVERIRAVIEITEQGGVPGGFDAAVVGLIDAPAGAESGRGLQLVRALMDEFSVTGRAGGGSVVRMVKTLNAGADSPLTCLSA